MGPFPEETLPVWLEQQPRGLLLVFKGISREGPYSYNAGRDPRGLITLGVTPALCRVVF